MATTLAFACTRSRPTLNEKGRDEIRKVLLQLRDTEMKIAESNESCESIKLVEVIPYPRSVRAVLRRE